MRKFNISDYKGGWIVGNFTPNLIHRDDFELGVKYISAGFVDQAHYHKEGSEYNVLVEGSLKNGEIEIGKGEIFVFGPYDVAKIEAVTDSIVVVFRAYSDPQDKFIA